MNNKRKKRIELINAIYKVIDISKLPAESVITILETIKLDIILNSKLVILDGKIGAK